MIRLVLFDIDGTLIATGGAGVRAFASVARATFGSADGFARFNFAGRTDGSIVRDFFLGCGIEPTTANFERFFDDYVFWLDHHLGERPGRVLPGVWECLRSLRAMPEVPMIGLLTGNIRLGAELKLRHFGLWSEFVVGAFGDEHELRGELARIARERGEEMMGCRLAEEDVLVIGDTPLDIGCAKSIGARCLAVASGGATLEVLRNHEPTWAYPSLAEVNIHEVCT